jgi:hypothetical protein
LIIYLDFNSELFKLSNGLRTHHLFKELGIMAKKESKNKAEGGQGYKVCPKCLEDGRPAYTPARTTECPDCGYHFRATALKKDRSGRSRDVDIEKEAMRFALGSGSVDKALKAVEGYKEDELGKFIALCGGADKAKAELAKLKF